MCVCGGRDPYGRQISEHGIDDRHHPLDDATVTEAHQIAAAPTAGGAVTTAGTGLRCGGADTVWVGWVVLEELWRDLQRRMDLVRRPVQEEGSGDIVGIDYLHRPRRVLVGIKGRAVPQGFRRHEPVEKVYPKRESVRGVVPTGAIFWAAWANAAAGLDGLGVVVRASGKQAEERVEPTRNR